MVATLLHTTSDLGFLLLSSLLPVSPGESTSSKRLTNFEKQQFSLPENLKQILVGNLLGDLYCRKRFKTGNAVFRFEQGICHNEYIEHLHDLFESYCPSLPKTTNRLPDKRTGKIYNSVYFTTYALPCFNELYYLFYVEGKKVIPLNIGELLTPLGLCY
jgi:hypothetical protein